MCKTIVFILLTLMLFGCTSQNNKPSLEKTSQSNKIILQDKYEFKALNSSFAFLLPKDWLVAQDVTPSIETNPLIQQIGYMNKQEDVTTAFVVVSKTNPKTKSADYFFNDYIQKLKSDGEDFKELEPPVDYEDKNKTVKRFICDATLSDIKFRHIVYLIEFKNSDKFMIGYQACLQKDWDKHKEYLFEIIDSVNIK